MQFSQSSIKGLVQALAQLQQNIAAGGTASAQALADALAPLNTALTRIDGDATVAGSFRKETADAIAALIGAGTPASLNTLKEIADYITVNPGANVADAIHQAIANVQASVDTLSGVVTDEKTYLDNVIGSTIRKTATENVVLATLNGGQSMITTAFAIDTVLNFGTALFTHPTTNVSYQLNVVIGEGIAIDFAEYAVEVGDITGMTAKIQYTYAPDAVALRTSNGL